MIGEKQMEEMEYINKQLVEADIKAIKRYDVDINKTYAFIARRLYELKESEYFKNANYKGYKDIYDLALNEFGYESRKVRYLIEIYLKFFYENFDNYYKNFSISQLRYMAGMSQDKLKKCNPDMTVKEIKLILIENCTRVPAESIENLTSENAVSQEKVINGIFPDEKEEEKTITTIVTELPQEQRKENKTIVVDVKNEESEEIEDNLKKESESEYYKKKWLEEVEKNNEFNSILDWKHDQYTKLENLIEDYNLILKFISAEMEPIYSDYCKFNLDLNHVDYLIKSINDFIKDKKFPKKLYFMEKVI